MRWLAADRAAFAKDGPGKLTVRTGQRAFKTVPLTGCGLG